MEVNVPHLHEHHLCFDEYKNEDASCDKCGKQIDGLAYACECCKFWLHFSCVVSQLPKQISHPLHSKHSLKLYPQPQYYEVSPLSNFVCDKCFYLSRGLRYYCDKCDFKLDVICASPTTDQNPKEQISKAGPHFSHEHDLTFFNYRKVRDYEQSCSWCEKPLSGMSYGCFLCSDDFFLHESCFSKTPKFILKHPFHPLHSLQLHHFYYDGYTRLTCDACKQRIISSYYNCQNCKFCLHFLCAKHQPTLKHQCHEHNLTYFQIKCSGLAFLCRACGSNCCSGEGKSTFYRCVKCDFNIHFDCAPIPSITKNRYHRHSLTLINSFVEDKSEEYYCDICEEKRNSNNHVYHCKKCTYIAHIECALDKSIDKNHGFLMINKSSVEEEASQSYAEFSTTLGQIVHSDHVHPLKFFEANEKHERCGYTLCRACDLETRGQAGYACEYCESCSYHMHEKCATLPDKMLHPLHPQHRLILRSKSLISGFSICDECFDVVWIGFIYICFQCNFKLDVRCAALTTPQDKYQRLKKRSKRVTKLLHFSHNHELAFMNFWIVYTTGMPYCDACRLTVSGPTYGCTNCSYYLHEHCLQKLPKKIREAFHSQHPLHPLITDNMRCFACGYKIEIDYFYYSCSQCGIYLHFACVSFLRRALRSESHEHNLYSFHIPNHYYSQINYYFSQKCKKCGKSFSDGKYYRCIECEINFHLECISVPHIVKSRYHIHSLTLAYFFFLEDDYGGYFCDICEEERDPKQYVYYCEECDGLFVAHVECVLHSVERNELLLLKETTGELTTSVEKETEAMEEST